MRPPCRITIVRHKASPNPVPGVSLHAAVSKAQKYRPDSYEGFPGRYRSQQTATHLWKGHLKSRLPGLPQDDDSGSHWQQDSGEGAPTGRGCLNDWHRFANDLRVGVRDQGCERPDVVFVQAVDIRTAGQNLDRFVAEAREPAAALDLLARPSGWRLNGAVPSRPSFLPH